MIEFVLDKGSIVINEGKISKKGVVPDIPKTLFLRSGYCDELKCVSTTKEVTPKDSEFVFALEEYLNWNLKLDFKIVKH